MARPVSIEKKKFDYDLHAPVGIDLGTSNSAIAKWVNRTGERQSKVFKMNALGNEQMDTLMHSVVYLEESDGNTNFVVGREAYKRRISSPAQVASRFKRKIGDPDQKVAIGSMHLSPVKLSSIVLESLFKEVYSQGLREPVGVVVSVPYFFKQSQKHATREAIEMAINASFSGLSDDQKPKVLGLIPEPVAAALSYAVENVHHAINERILVVDLGGGTLDLTLLKLEISTVAISFEVLSTDGSAMFGGDDFDNILEAYVLEESGVTFNGIEEKRARIERQRIHQAVVEAKEALSEREMTSVMVPLTEGRNIDLDVKRSDFESLLCGNNKERRNFRSEFKDYLNKCMDKAQIPMGSVRKVLLVGGSSQIPLFRRLLAEEFKMAAILNLKKKENLYHYVAKGAAIYAAYLLDQKGSDEDVPDPTRPVHLAFSKKFGSLPGPAMIWEYVILTIL